MRQQAIDPTLWQEGLGALAIVGTVIGSPLLRPWYSHWGYTDDTPGQALPGDQIVPRPNLQNNRSILIRATPEEVWPWLLQIGQNRGGFYSYDWLENLVGLSFDQEDLMNNFAETGINTPRYVTLVQDQFKLEDDFGLIQDSLHALSKRVFQIESFVTEKVTEIKANMRESIQELEERRKPQAAEHQQRTMQNVNDLALMLSEVMNQMQQQMSGMMAGSQMCNNPGGQGGQNGNVPKDKMSPGQESINQAMQRMQERMMNGEGISSREFAEMAARQAALRNALRQKQQELREQGQGSPDLQEIIDGMDKIEEDLVNKRLTNEMLQRQQDILTRLLEHENAERQRELEEQRQSETARQRERDLPPSLQEYLRQRDAEIDMYKSVSPSLKPYYKYLVDEYFQRLRNEEKQDLV